MWLRGLCVTPKGEISKWVLKKAPVRVCQWSKHLLHKNDDTIFYPLALWLIDFLFFENVHLFMSRLQNRIKYTMGR